MTDARTTLKFEGIRAEQTTYDIDDSTITYESDQANGSSVVGRAVTLSTHKTVALAGDGEHVLGKLIKVEADGKAVVQDSGFCTLPGGTSATLTPGKAIVGDLLVSAKGYIREVATGTAAELGVQNGTIIDAGTTTAVVVKF